MKVACIFDSRNGGQDVAGKFTIHDWDSAVWHNGGARTVNMTTTNASANVTLSACDGIDSASALPWINHPVSRVGSDTGMPARSFLKSITTGTCAAVMSGNATVSGTFAVKIDNAPSRTVADGVRAVSTTITSATANFTNQDIGMSITGSGIPANTTITAVTNATTATISNAGLSAGGGSTWTFGGDIEATTTRQAVDSTATSTAANKITMAAAKFRTGFANANPNCATTCGDTGLKVTGPGLSNCIIASVAGSIATMTTNCVTSATFIAAPTKAIVIGDPSITAPNDGEGIEDQGVQLDLQPLLVAGSNACTLDDAEGFHIVGQWKNPGSITGVTQPDGTKAIGEIFFHTSATDYGGLVVERGAAAAGDPQLNAHYDLVFPSVPITLALCNSATSPGLGFSVGIVGSTPYIAGVRAGNGKPGTAQLRAVRDDGGAGWAGSAYVRSDDPAVTDWTGSEFERLCVVPAGNPTVDFKCGAG